ncbi:MAG: tRNA 4-thiouridine(8) synthase ThiI [Clostridiales bacterium]|nr:tRNA 4-thiouridine(8) synthase ThiI [Clostridiales bacterium]
MKEIVMLKYGEIILKGQNRYRFEEILIKNIKNALKSFGRIKVFSAQSTVYVDFLDDETDISFAVDSLKKVFGVSSLTRAYRASYDFDEAKAEAAEYLKFELMKAKTFKVAAKRADKRYPFNSMQIGAFMGEYLLQRFKNLSVDLHNPDIIVYVEVREGHLYIHSTPEKGAGGLPVGSSGHGLLMLSGGIDSPVAGYKMAKRGMRISAIHFESPPYTSERARIKVEKLAEKLSAYASDIKLYVVEFTEIQEKIRDICRDDLFTVIMRRVMLRIANKVAAECGAGVVITGESLGQVASQTMNAIICTDSVSEIPVFRPLIGDDKQEIIDVSYRIDTYDISIEPYEDCCTVFTPRHPKTSPKKEEVEFEESKLDIDNLLTDISINVKTIYPVRK